MCSLKVRVHEQLHEQQLKSRQAYRSHPKVWSWLQLILLNYETSGLWEFPFGFREHVLSLALWKLGVFWDDALPSSGSFLPHVVVISTQPITLRRHIRSLGYLFCPIALASGIPASTPKIKETSRIYLGSHPGSRCRPETFSRSNHSIMGLTSFVSHLLEIIFLL